MGKLEKALWAVPFPIPNSREISAQEWPSSRSAAILVTSTSTRGRPNFFPFSLALLSPAFTLSAMMSLSN